MIVDTKSNFFNWINNIGHYDSTVPTELLKQVEFNVQSEDTGNIVVFKFDTMYKSLFVFTNNDRSLFLHIKKIGNR